MGYTITFAYNPSAGERRTEQFTYVEQLSHHKPKAPEEIWMTTAACDSNPLITAIIQYRNKS